jgi:Domain of unknown function (DUF4604)
MASTPKFNAKNLHFEKHEPAFLQKLRGEAAGRGDSDRHEVQQARPGKKSRLEMDDDNGPTIVFEDEAGFSGGANVGREEYEMLMKGKRKGEGTGKDDEGEVEGQGESAGVGKGGEDVESASGGGEEREKQKVAEVGGIKKRKVGKVVAGEGEEPKASTKTSASADRTIEFAKPQVKPKAKASKKKVKLSFDEPDV